MDDELRWSAGRIMVALLCMAKFNGVRLILWGRRIVCLDYKWLMHEDVNDYTYSDQSSLGAGAVSSIPLLVAILIIVISANLDPAVIFLINDTPLFLLPFVLSFELGQDLLGLVEDARCGSTTSVAFG